MVFQMTLHQDKELFREAIEAAAGHFQLRPVFVEKDYWVTYVLRNLALSPYFNTVVFKGGTSLSKAYQCIDRFSEDVSADYQPAIKIKYLEYPLPVNWMINGDGFPGWIGE